MASTRIRQPKDLNKKALNNQIQNRNYLAPTGFQFNVSRAPKVTYFGNQVNIPSLTLGIANQPSYLKDIPRPGEKIDFDDSLIYSEFNKSISERKIPMIQMMRNEALKAFELWDKKTDKVKY